MNPLLHAPSLPHEANQVWQATLARLQGQTSAAHFETYLRDTVGIQYDAGASVLHVAAANPFHVPWLEGKFSTAIHRALAEVLDQPVRVEFLAQTISRAAPARERPRPAPVRPLDALLEGPDQALPKRSPAQRAAPVSATSASARSAGARVVGSPLNQRYTFETFVVGQSNQLAHAASRAVADEPGRAYNPLFLYGGVGLGKTHLLHAIGQAVLALGLQVVYVSSETFTNELIESIRQHRTDDFRAKYRRGNLLLIDDVQFIAGKERTEEEFFHTFNAIHEAGGQIVLSSDRPPRAMTVLEDRLRSRFEWGLIADVQAPDYETRVAILQSKLVGPLAATVPSEVVDFIARQVQSNIRELEGSLNRLLAHARYLRQPVTVELAGIALRDLGASRKEAGGATPEGVLAAVSRYFGVTQEQLKGRARHKEIVVPRHVAMYLLREDGRLSTPEIGRLLNRDHTTILHGANIVANDVASDGPSRASIRGVRAVLAAGTDAA